MIIRLTNNLAKKIKETDLPLLPSDPNPFVDWAARLFTADRAQYILITNSVSLYSVVIYGRGVTDDNALIHGMTDMLRDVMEKDGLRLLYEKQVAPQAARISFSKAINRSVTGSMNDLVFQAKWHLIRDEISPYDLSFRLNEVPMSYLKYQHPRDAFQSMRQKLVLVR
jgi:hypothetical protein